MPVRCCGVLLPDMQPKAQALLKRSVATGSAEAGRAATGSAAMGWVARGWAEAGLATKVIGGLGGEFLALQPLTYMLLAFAGASQLACVSKHWNSLP